MYQLTDHPVIRYIERTGYPYSFRDEPLIGCCSRCGRSIYEYDDYETRGFIDPDLICEGCLLDEEDEESEE